MEKSGKRKAESDGQDILTPLVESLGGDRDDGVAQAGFVAHTLTEDTAMRFRTLVTAALVAPPPSGLAAQAGFEGVITMRVGMAKGPGVETRLYLKGAQARMERSGAMGVLIRDSNGRLMTVIDGGKRYVVFGKAPENGLKFVATGKSETVAGYLCKYYKVIHTDKKQEDTEACITGAFGFVGLGSGGDSRVLDERALKSQFGDGFLVLKLLDSKGATSTEVIKVERRAVSDAMFAPPAGYLETKLPGGLTPQRP